MTRCRKNYSGSARTQEQPTYSGWKQALNELQEVMIVAPVDKAAHDLAICCRQWYLQKLRDELLNARVYQQSREAKEEIIVRHRAKAEEFQYASLQLLHNDLQQRLDLTLREKDETIQHNHTLQERLTEALDEVSKLRGNLTEAQTQEQQTRQTLQEVTIQKVQVDATLKEVTDERDKLKKKKRCVIM
ncbi:hypothetical protein PAPYR_4648 [Paratrimastix pyriformis]|uniref:Uncharacterized protein n=1 Tax=Paratrimastix pyriformis TaxID=342808 RepID=A0ABQ8UPB0_9EUKA|nr:hypothetical protein PAPYR_4648 [Paratrimastix pyriformis]